jgi:hypothetical protein
MLAADSTMLTEIQNARYRFPSGALLQFWISREDSALIVGS